MKSITIEDAVHQELKDFCKRGNYKVNAKASDLLKEILAVLKERKEKGYVLIEK